jgi:hypothetical protein
MKDRLQPSESFPSLADLERVETIKGLDTASGEILESSLLDDSPLARVQVAYLRNFADYYRNTYAELQSLSPEDIPEFNAGHSEWLKNQRFLHHDRTKRRLSSRLTWNNHREIIEPLWVHKVIANYHGRDARSVLRDIEAGMETLVRTKEL